MVPERIEELFLEVAELPVEDRAAFLDANCGADAQLREAVENLLLADSRADSRVLWQGSALDSESRQVAGEQNSLCAGGGRLGPYRIVKEIGAGGMGIVCEAVRDDNEFEKRVAIKLVHTGFGASAETLERFRLERQILADLEHPFIARLLDGGTGPEGQPYLVMEYVDGPALNEYIVPLDLKRRLALFRQICAAAAYAHRHLVIHRDLKPSNIRIAPDGTPRLLDFGVAVFLSARDVNTNLAFTREFASPEQKAGGTLTIASDVYSLGVILATMIPSDADPDLKAIVAAATQADPSSRYGSAELLSDDIRRYLEQRPVLARRQSPAYRFAKLVQRRPWTSAAAASIVIVSAVSFVAFRAKDRVAEERLQDVRRIADTKEFQAGGSLAVAAGSTSVRGTLNERAVESLEQLLKDSPDDPRIQRDLATAYQRLALVQGTVFSANYGERKTARATMEKALDLNQKLFEANPSSLANRSALVDTLGYLGRMALSDGNPQEAYDLHERAWRESAPLIALGPSADEPYMSASRIAYLLGIDFGGIGYSANLGRPDLAVALHEQSLRMLDDWSKQHPGRANVNIQAALRHQILAVDYLRLRKWTEAEEHARRAIDLMPRERPAVGSPGDPRTWCTVRFHYALVSAEEQRPELAIPPLEQALETAKALVDADPQNVRARLDAAVIEGLLARVQSSPRRSQAAVAVLEDLLRSDPDHAEVRGALTLEYLWAGDLARKANDLAGALRDYRRSEELASETLRAQPADANARENVAAARERLDEGRIKQQSRRGSGLVAEPRSVQ